jgi:hypothetical protein
VKFDLRNKWFDILGALLLYATVLVYQGYQYGQGDQTQILPCLYAQDHIGAYAGDQYVQYYLHSGFNERTIFHFLFRYLGYQVPTIVWLWHMILSVALILAWIRISSFFIKSKGFQWLTIGMILTLGFHTSTGSNEIYYNSFIPSLAAKAIASWAIVLWLTARFSGWSLLLLVATLLQPLVGLQLFLLTSCAHLVDLLIHKKIKLFPWRQSLMYLVIALPLLYLLLHRNGSGDDPKTFFDIIQFRLAHHFFASSFGFINLSLGLVFAMLAVYYMKQRLRAMIILIIVGCIIYEIGVEYYHLPIFLYTQWWKTTIWMEAFAFVAIGAWLEKNITHPKVVTRFPYIVPVILLAMVSIYRLSGIRSTKPDYMFPWTTTKSDEVEISEQAATHTPENAVFITPIEFTAFRWYSKRSLYVDYKAMVHQEAFLKEWYKRIQNIYQFGEEEQKGGFDLHNFSFYLLDDPSPMSFEYWKKLGITHIVSTNLAIKDLTLVAKNGKYAIYKL